MNWYNKLDITRVSADASSMRIIDLQRWALLHKMLCKRLGINIDAGTTNRDLDDFHDISATMAELTDKLGRLPRSNEFMHAWFLKHPGWVPASETVLAAPAEPFGSKP